MNPPNPLLELKDIHLPAPVSSWPFAFGWYLLAFFILVLLIAGGLILTAHWKRFRLRRYVRDQIKQLEKDLEQPNHEKWVAIQLSILLRRICLALFPRQEVAGLTGREWLIFLDEKGGTKEFTEGVGRLLIEAPYTLEKTEQMKALVMLSKKWIQSCLYQSFFKMHGFSQIDPSILKKL